MLRTAIEAMKMPTSLNCFILLWRSLVSVGYIDFLSFSQVPYRLFPPYLKFIKIYLWSNNNKIMLKVCLINLELAFDVNSLFLSIIKNEHPEIDTSILHA